ncbi:FecR family protein [Pseudomonas yamanorum]|uniref:FecR family protein n=1 Tax=Pseudomonas TaxID=286 RepID=UPI0015A38D42|nr:MULTISPECIES: FecR family protein [Pseudomonas]MCS3420521.1 ferric-dicitrate binding protein FerR (iron transport regulator) [Pseudomonas sp. BIGb0558]MCS3440460.1 ferric-dicitrate binding protein FerR (iron transport regulator) [Pseudomonas sp. BIGb0450]NWE41232.1 FecR family protein [Pseudomonas yamanorum]
MNIFNFSAARNTPDSPLHDEARDWLVLLTSGRATVADAKALRQWCAQSPDHARAFEQAKVLWRQLAPAAEQFSRPRHFGRRAFLGGAIAASAAVLMVRVTVPGGFAGLTADYRTEVGEQRRVELSDGVRLELNTQTRISRRDDGIELLEGEVEVLANVAMPLRVQAGGGWLSTAQARFNVRNTDHSVCVTCIDGAVAVAVGGRTVRLESGRQVTYDASGVGEPVAVDTQAVVAWREQVLVFDNATLATVVDEINRYRPGMLLLMNAQLGKRRVQARFSLNQLAGVALLIRDAYGAKCTELPGGVVLLS